MAAESDIVATALQTNGRTNPIGLPTTAPTFSWQSESTARGVLQTAYEVRVTDGDDAVVWDTTKVNSAEQLNVVYAGTALTDQTRYHWQVKVWDNSGNESAWSPEAWFETGLNVSNWNGDWISAPSAYPALAKWSNYTFTTNFTLDALLLGVYFRASDANNGYMWQLSVAKGGTSIELRPHKKVGGGFTLLAEKDVSSVITADALKTGTHELKIVVDGSTITTSIDGTVADTRTDSTFATGYVGFRQDNSDKGVEMATIHSVNVTAKTGEVLMNDSFDNGNPFNIGNVANGDLKFTTPSSGILDTSRSSSPSNLPIFRKEFSSTSGKTITSARIYAAARGVYELSLNGEKVGDEHLAPGWTDYNKSIQYQTYDVTDQVTDGANALGAYIAPGWYSGNIASFGNNHYGTTPSLIAQLRIDYSDGTHSWVKTDDTWNSTSGPIVSSDIIDGETYDATAELAGWNETGFDDAAWKQVGVQPTATPKLTAQRDEPVRQTEQKPAQVRTEPTPGTYIYDLKQNMVGVARLALTGEVGSTAVIRYGEVLNPDGSLYTANLRSAKVTDYYTFSETGTATYEPKFTYHGYRYIEVTGVTSAPALADITGLVWGSDLDTTGSFQTSDAMLNQLQSNITWGQRGNFLSIPTDTPARDERLGWTGDINVFAPTASYNSDSLAFLTKWLVDLRSTQGSDGNFRGVAPYSECCGGGTGWSDAMITVPYALYQAYGDTAVVNENYVAMNKFMDFMISWSGTDLINDGSGYLDWLNLDDPTPSNVLGTAYFAEDARMLSEMAAGIGETAKAEQLATLSEGIRAAFAAKFIAADGTISGKSQAGYAMAIGMGMVPDDKLSAVGDKFVAKLASKDNHLSTGFLGTPWLLPALTKTGHQDLAFRLLQNKDYPSWGYEVEKGATTVWERWNSIMPDGSFGDVSMNSFNHYAYGAVGTWMYQNIGGIAPAAAGYKKITIAPTPGGGLTEGHGSIDSVYGTVSSDWELTDTGVTLDVKIPVNTTATVRIPAANALAVSEGGTSILSSDDFSDVTAADGFVSFALGSGTYSFTSDARAGAFGPLFDALDTFSSDADDADLGDVVDLIADARTSATTAVNELTSGGNPLEAMLDTADAAKAARAAVDSDELRADSDAVELLIGDIVATQLGVSVLVAPVESNPLPGDTVTGAVTVVNGSVGPISDLSATVALDPSYTATPDRFEAVSVATSETTQLPFTVAIPDDADNGEVTASLTASFSFDGHDLRVASTGRLVTVASPVVVSEATATAAGSLGTVTATLTNSADYAVSGHVILDTPDGWAASSGSSEVSVPAGQSVTVAVPFFVPVTVNEDSFDLTAAFERGDTVLSSKTATLALDIVTPPAAIIDHVDLGEDASETAHHVTGSASSGKNTEAGLTRRYSNAQTPGSWFAFDLAVTPGKPFVMTLIETYDNPATKKYDFVIDGTEASGVLSGGTKVFTREYSRPESGQGTKTYSVQIPDGAYTADGTVRVALRYTTETGFHDPSIADVWSTSVGNLAPTTAATLTAGSASGANGWVRGPVNVAITAADDTDPAPSIEADSGAGFATYTEPIAVTEEGATTLKFRATDATELTGETNSLTVKLDSVAPISQVTSTKSSDPATLDQGSIGFTSSDATSGVASVTYRLDGSEWKTATGSIPVSGFGNHTVEYFATDVAGNAETPKSAVISFADVTTLAAITAPVVSGSAVIGQTLAGSTGSWNTFGLSYAFQWLRDGADIAGATAATYAVTAADAGKHLAVRVTASKPGLASASSTSAQTAVVPAVVVPPVVKKSTTVKVTLPKSTVSHTKKAIVKVTVTAKSGKPTGTVVIKYGSKSKTVTLTVKNKGTVSVTLPKLKKGTYKVSATYKGNSVYKADTSSTKKLRIK